MKSKTIAKVGAFLTAFTVFAGSMLPVYAASVDETDSTEESTAAAAEGDEESFLFQLEVDGKDTVNVNPGDVITVSFTLKRTDAEEAYTMYAMQDEIAYDSNFFELVDGSALVTNGIETRDLAMRDNMRKFYMNYVSMSGAVVGHVIEVSGVAGINDVKRPGSGCRTLAGAASGACSGAGTGGSAAAGNIRLDGDIPKGIIFTR